MSLRSKIDFSELKRYKDSMLLMEKDCNDFLKDCLIEFGEEVVDKTKSLTPVDTGALRDSWGLTTKWMVPYHTTLFSQKKQRMVRKTLFIRGGGVNTRGGGTSMSVTISNPQKYAEIIEYKYYMLTSALAMVRHEMPSMYEEKFNKFKTNKGL